MLEKVTGEPIKYHLIILEILDSEKEDIHFISKLRKWELNEQQIKTPIIAVVTNINDDAFWKSEENNPLLQLTKPIRKQLLLDAVNNYATNAEKR